MTVTADDLRHYFHQSFRIEPNRIAPNPDLLAYLLWGFNAIEAESYDVDAYGSPYVTSTLSPAAYSRWIVHLLDTAQEDIGISYAGYVKLLGLDQWLWVPSATRSLDVLAIQVRFEWVGRGRFPRKQKRVFVEVVEVDQRPGPFVWNLEEAANALKLPAFDQDQFAENCWESRAAAEKDALEEGASPADAEEAGFEAERQCVDSDYREYSHAIVRTLKHVAHAASLDITKVTTPDQGEVFQLNPTHSWARTAEILADSVNSETLLDALSYKGGITPRQYLVYQGLDTLLVYNTGESTIRDIYHSMF
jgi:hypothetical protein